MTVTYTQNVATAKYAFYVRLLLRWKGSIYKLIWKDFVLFLILYYMLRVLYRNILNESQKRVFESIAEYAMSYTVLIPFSFVLGFYMHVIFQRWQGMFEYITWPDRMALAVTANIKGLDERGRLIRRTIMRYLIVGYIMNQRSVCPSVKRRFPTMNHLTQAGLLTDQEEKIIEDIEQKRVNKYVIPFLWAVNVVALARKEGRIYDDYAVCVLNQELLQYRTGLGMILRYDIASIPLVYTQSITLAVHMFVLFTLFGRQFLEQRQDGGGGDIDQYVHFGALLQFLLYMGWLKLAEMMINPFEDDDDDFDMNLLIDRNLQYCYLVVDDLHADLPPLWKDTYWNQTLFNLPYTEAMGDQARDVNTELGSAYEVVVPEDKISFVATHDDGPLHPKRKPTLATRKLPPTPEEPLKLWPTLTPDAAHGHGKSLALGQLKKTASGGLAYPKKFLETVEHQFRSSDGLVEISDPFDNRFEELDRESMRDSYPGHEGRAGKIHPDMEKSGDAQHGASTSAHGVLPGIRRLFRRNHSQGSKLSAADIDGNSTAVPPDFDQTPSKPTAEDPPQVPPPPPPSPQEHTRHEGASWFLQK